MLLESVILKESLGKDKLDKLMFDNFSKYLAERGWKKIEPNKKCTSTLFLKKDLKIETDKFYNVNLYANIGEEFYKIGFVMDSEGKDIVKADELLIIINNY